VAEVLVEADVVTIPDPAFVHSVPKKIRKSIIKTSIYYAATYMKMAKFVLADKPVIVQNTSGRCPLPSNVHVIWPYFPLQAKFCARLTL
jgi:hypothetical protein